MTPPTKVTQGPLRVVEDTSQGRSRETSEAETEKEGWRGQESGESGTTRDVGDLRLAEDEPSNGVTGLPPPLDALV